MKAKFDLLASPFAMLNLSAGANATAIAEAFEDALFEDDSPARERELNLARESLTKPRSRLEAELTFLPGTGEEETREILTALRTGSATPATDALHGLARANYLAHQCSSGGTGTWARKAKALVHAHDDVSLDVAMTSIGAARRESGLAQPDPSTVTPLLARLRERHADLVVEALLTDDDGPEAMAGLAHELAGLRGGRRDFIETVITRYETAVAPRLEEAAAEALRLLDKIKPQGDPAGMDDFRRTLRAWDRLAQPLQLADQARDIDEPHSRDLFEKIRSACITMANEHHAHDTALAISRVAQEVFAELGDAVELLEKDMSVLEGNVRHGLLKELADAVADAEAKPAVLRTELQVPGHNVDAKPHVTAIFAALNRVVAGGDPALVETAARIVRQLAISLNNSSDDHDAALKLISSLLAFDDKLPASLLRQLKQDQKTLLVNIQFGSLTQALKAEKFDVAESIARRLLLDADAEQTKSLHSTLAAIEVRRKKQSESGGGGVLWVAGIILALVFIGVNSGTREVVVDETASDAAAPVDFSYGQSPPAPPADAALPLPAIDQEAALSDPISGLGNTSGPGPDNEEEKPEIGTVGVYGISQLRYCRRQKERIEAAESAVTSQDQIDRFNAAVNDYNPRCGSFRYNQSDMSIVDGEVERDKALLATEGVNIINGVE